MLRNIESIALKMQLLGAKVEILTDSTLLQSPSKDKTIFYKLEGRRLIAKHQYKNIERIGKTGLCRTKSYNDYEGLVDIDGNTIVKPGFRELNFDYDSIIIATLTNGLKSILDYSGNELLPYTMSSVKIVKTPLGDVIDVNDRLHKANLLLIERSEDGVKLLKLNGLNEKIGDKLYVLMEDNIIIKDGRERKVVNYKK